jgi:hypothetical protein
MNLGHRVLEELRRRKLHGHLLYADLQALKAVTDPRSMRAYFAAKGCAAGEDRADALHFADLFEILILRKELQGARAGLVLFGLS